MNTLVVYDSVFGNTQMIAETIAGELAKSNQVQLCPVAAAPADLTGIERLVVGSPTRAFNMTQALKTWIAALTGAQLNGLRFAAFDTRINLIEVKPRLLGWFIRRMGYAAQRIDGMLIRAGAVRLIEPAGFLVDGTEGPLTAGEVGKAQAWAARMI